MWSASQLLFLWQTGSRYPILEVCELQLWQCRDCSCHIFLRILAVSRLHLIDPSSIEHNSACSYRIFIPWASRGTSADVYYQTYSNRKLSIVMALSSIFTQCAPKTIKFGKITQNKAISPFMRLIILQYALQICKKIAYIAVGVRPT